MAAIREAAARGAVAVSWLLRTTQAVDAAVAAAVDADISVAVAVATTDYALALAGIVTFVRANCRCCCCWCCCCLDRRCHDYHKYSTAATTALQIPSTCEDEPPKTQARNLDTITCHRARSWVV